MRTPLAVLRGELEALQDGIRPYTREAVDSLLGDVLRLNRLTDDLYQLSLSDLGALSYRKVPLDPVRILKEDIDALSAEARGKKLSVSLTDRLARPATIHADPDRLSQLYRNLLTNSINYTDCGGRLEIAVERRGNFLEVVFSDSEPGIPDSELPRLFDRFYRVESSRSRHHGGAGLGLAICANIVAAHNGAITAGPSRLNGLEIQVRLPLLT
ncbi:MAG: ATP-binding protein [Gammaproteobacteria bacterium]